MRKKILIFIVVQTLLVILCSSSKLSAFGVAPIQVVNEFVKAAKTADFRKLADLSCKDYELYLTLEDAKKLNLGAFGFIEEIVREEISEIDPKGLYIVISRAKIVTGEICFICFLVFKTDQGWKVYISKEDLLLEYPINELLLSKIAFKFYYTNKINLDLALNLAKRVVTSGPNNVESYIMLGRVYYTKGFQEDAIAAYAKAIKIKINEDKGLESYAEKNIEPKEVLIGTWKVLLNDPDERVKYYVAEKLYDNGFRNNEVISLLTDKYKPDPNSEQYPDIDRLKKFVEIVGNRSLQYLIKYATSKLIGQRISAIENIFKKDKDNWELCWNKKPTREEGKKIPKFYYYNKCDNVMLLNKDNIHLLISYQTGGYTLVMWGKATSQNKYNGKWVKTYGGNKVYSSGDFCVEFISENMAKGWTSYGGTQVLFELTKHLGLSKKSTGTSENINTHQKEPYKELTPEEVLKKQEKDNAIMEEARKKEIPSLQKEGSNAIKDQNWNAAIQVYTKLLEISPENYDANTNIGAAYTMLNEFDLSIKHLKKAQEIKPAEYQPHYLMGIAYARRGDKDRATESLQDAIYKGYKDLSVSDLEKDTNLPEDFKQDYRFKGLLGKLEINKLISGVKDANLFDSHYSEFKHNYDDVWEAVKYVLDKQKEKIITSDKESGVIITDTCKWSMNRKYYKYYILIEKTDETTAKLNLKLIAHNSNFDGNLKRSVLKPMNRTFVNDKYVKKFIYEVREKLGDKK